MLDRYSQTPYYYTMPKVSHLPPFKCQSTPSRSFAFLVKAHTKLPILHIRISQRDTEMEITGRYGYATSIGSLVWALTKGESDWKRAFDYGQVTGDTWPGVNDLLSARRNGRDYRASDHSDRETQHSLGYIAWNFHVNKQYID